MEIVGVTRLDDVFERDGIIEQHQRTSVQRVRHFTRRHVVPVVAGSMLLLAAVTGWSIWKAWYDHPNLERVHGITVATSSIVYNPKDTLAWCMRDGRRVVAPVVPFGDLELGDGMSRNLWIWNFGIRDLSLRLEIEGEDAEDWYINWNPGDVVIESVDTLRMSVMFAPRTVGARKRAALVLRDDWGNEQFRVTLTGGAGPPLPAGYAVRLDGVDDMLSFGVNATVFDAPEGTFECWMCPGARASCSRRTRGWPACAIPSRGTAMPPGPCASEAFPPTPSNISRASISEPPSKCVVSVRCISPAGMTPASYPMPGTCSSCAAVPPAATTCS
jgi:hypothetical protein